MMREVLLKRKVIRMLHMNIRMEGLKRRKMVKARAYLRNHRGMHLKAKAFFIFKEFREAQRARR